MGTSSSSHGDGSNSNELCGATDPNFRFLMGKVTSFGPAAQRLFNLGKLYISASDDGEQTGKDKNAFGDLFPPLNVSPAEADKAFQLFHPLRKSKPLHHGQTYVQWKVSHDYQSASYLLCMHKRNVIYIQPLDEFPDFVKNFQFQRRSIRVNLFELIQGFAQIFFSGLDVMVLPDVRIVEEGWDIASRYHQTTGQKQFLVNDFYPRLQHLLPHNGVCILGFIWTDLFPENYNFVLGEASPKHQSGIFSFGRFPPSTFNANDPQDLTEITGEIIWKLFKVVSHEVCHLFGLNHCEFFHCAMNESNSVAEAMFQPLFLCPVCLRKLYQVCGFDVVERYTELQDFLKDINNQLPYHQLLNAVQWLEECLSFLKSEG